MTREPLEEGGTGQRLPRFGHLRILVDPLGCHQHGDSVSGGYDAGGPALESRAGPLAFLAMQLASVHLAFAVIFPLFVLVTLVLIVLTVRFIFKRSQIDRQEWLAARQPVAPR